MLKKDIKKGSTVYHKQFGKAEFVGWFDHETKDYARIKLHGLGSYTIHRSELSSEPRKIPGIKPGWYSSSSGTAHFWVPNDVNGNYRSVCGKAKAAGEALIPEAHPRCKRCEISTRDAVKTTLLDFQKGRVI